LPEAAFVLVFPPGLPPRVGFPSFGGQTSGGVVNQLKRSHFLEELTGKIHRIQYDAVYSINPDLAQRTLKAQTG
jgi:hypothetical protein